MIIMSTLSTNAFADPEDSQIVVDAKKVASDPVSYSYTEVTILGHMRMLLISYLSREMSSCTILESALRRKS